MKILSTALVAFLLSASAFAQTPTPPTPPTKQPTQEGGNSRTPCNLVANPTADPDCAGFKQKTQNLTPPVNPATKGK